MIAKITLFMIILFTSLYSTNEIRIMPPRSIDDSNHKYFYHLLKEIIKNIPKQTQDIKIIQTLRMEQGRAFIQLKRKQHIDIHWAGTSLKREEEFIPIKIPLIKGLLGYRVFIIHKDKLEIFNKIKTFKELQKLTACQGTHWPDTKILENSKIKVIKNTNFELLFLQLSKGRCDYFPRGVNEAYVDMKARENKYPELILYDKIILYYPFPMYFFVNKENKKLANKIKKGLEVMVDNGTLTEYIKNHENTKHLFPLNNWRNVTTFKLYNPFLSKDTDINNPRLWIIPK